MPKAKNALLKLRTTSRITALAVFLVSVFNTDFFPPFCNVRLCIEWNFSSLKEKKFRTSLAEGLGAQMKHFFERSTMTQCSSRRHTQTARVSVACVTCLKLASVHVTSFPIVTHSFPKSRADGSPI